MSANCLSALAHIWRGGEGQVIEEVRGRRGKESEEGGGEERKVRGKKELQIDSETAIR